MRIKQAPPPGLGRLRADLVQVHAHHHQVRRVNALEPAGLAQRRGLELGQHQLGLAAQPADRGVVEVRRQRPGLLLSQTLDRARLPPDVAGVLRIGFIDPGGFTEVVITGTLEVNEENQLEGVIKLPSGVFKPYAGVSTAMPI